MSNEEQIPVVVDPNPYGLTDFEQKNNDDDQPAELNLNQLNKLVDVKDDEENKDSEDIKTDDSTADNSLSENSRGSEYESCGEKICETKYLIISSAITFCFVAVASFVAVFVQSEDRLHIVTRTLEIVDIIGGYLLWGCHCFALIILPWLLYYLFDQKLHVVYYFLPCIMMAFNMVGGFIPITYSCYPLIVEVLIIMFLLFHLPFKTIYIPKTKKFWLGEMTLMMLAFIYISSTLGASTVTYMIFAQYIRINDQLTSYPPNPHHGIAFIKGLDSIDGVTVNGSYLACYSLFTFFAVGIGFLMSFRHSFFMAIPFAGLAAATIIETLGIGVLLFCQLFLHLLYMTLIQFNKSRKCCIGCCDCDCCDCCYESCNTTLTTIILGDLIAFAMIVFPLLGLTLNDYCADFPWGFFIGGSLIIMVGVLLHVFVAFDPDSIWKVILAPIFLGGSVYCLGIGFQGYVPFIRAFTFEITYLSWSFALCFWAWCNGYSPVLFKTYNALIAVCALVIIELYEGIGWIEILFGAVQIFFDTYMIIIVQRLEAKYIAWSVFAVSGIVLLGLLAGVCFVLFCLMLYAVLTCIGSFCGTYCEILEAQNYLRSHNLKIGDTFECAGKTWKVTG